MGEYFKPWRRKFGVATLILACLLAVVWVRSYSAMSVLYFPSRNRDNNVPLHNGSLIWFSMEMPEEDFAEYMEGWDTWPPFAIVFAYPKRELSLKGFDRQSSSWGFEFYERRHRELVDTVCVVPLWLVVIPPTLLSAYVLLGKSHSKRPANSSPARSNSADSSADSPSHPGQNV